MTSRWIPIAVLLLSTEAHTSTHGGARKSYPGFTCAVALSVGESGDGQREIEQIRAAEAAAQRIFDQFAPRFAKRLQAFAADKEIRRRFGDVLATKAKMPHARGEWGGAKAVELEIRGQARRLFLPEDADPSLDFHVTLHLRDAAAAKLRDVDRQRLAWAFVRFEAARAPWLPQPTPAAGEMVPEAIASRLEFLGGDVTLDALAVAAELRAYLALIAADPKRLPLRAEGEAAARERVHDESLLKALSWHAVLTNQQAPHPALVPALKRLIALSPARVPDLVRTLIALAPVGAERALLDAIAPHLAELPAEHRDRARAELALFR